MPKSRKQKRQGSSAPKNALLKRARKVFLSRKKKSNVAALAPRPTSKHLEPFFISSETRPGMDTRTKKAKRIIAWCRSWARTPLGARRLKWLAKQDIDLGVALNAVKTIMAYGVGHPSSIDRIADIQDLAAEKKTGFSVDWEQYDGPEGLKKLKEDLEREYAWFRANKDKLVGSSGAPSAPIKNAYGNDSAPSPI